MRFGFEFALARGSGIDRVPYEMLFTRGEFDPAVAFAELHRRLRRTVFYMARGAGLSVRDSVSAVGRVFLNFAPGFPGSPPQLGMRRLASAITAVVGGDAFTPFFYYVQIPLYYMQDDEERRILATLYESGGTLSELELAAKCGLPDAAAARTLIASAVASFLHVAKDLPEDDLKIATGGVFPL